MDNHLYGILPASPQVIKPFNPAPGPDGFFLAKEDGTFIISDSGSFILVKEATAPVPDLVTDSGTFIVTDDGVKLSLA